jgi:hypothetical protein
VTKKVVDLNDELLTEAACMLGTTTVHDTVNRALADVVGRRREDLVVWLSSDPLPDLRDPEVQRISATGLLDEMDEEFGPVPPSITAGVARQWRNRDQREAD